MKTRSIIINESCALYITLFCQSQYNDIDAESMKTPRSKRTYEEIATYLTRNLTTERARAFYIWIAYNIEYDLD